MALLEIVLHDMTDKTVINHIKSNVLALRHGETKNEPIIIENEMPDDKEGKLRAMIIG